MTPCKRLNELLELEGLELLGDVEDDQAALAKLLGDLGLRVGLDLAARGDAREVDRAESVGAHGPATARRGWPRQASRRPARVAGAPPSRRLSSSGTEARCSASERVILPIRTSCARCGVHGLHPDRPGGLHSRVDLVGLPLADQVADRRGRDEHLAGDDAARAVGGRQQLLGDDPLERDRELHPDLVLLRGGKTSMIRSTVWAVDWV